jgi:hypothetical protein
MLVFFLSDGIILLLGLEYAGWSLFVRRHNSTHRTLVCWVVFVFQTVYLYSWHLSMLGGLCLLDSITLLVALEQVEWSLPDIPYNFKAKTTQHAQVRRVELCRLKNKDHPTYSSPRSRAIPSEKQRPPNILKS